MNSVNASPSLLSHKDYLKIDKNYPAAASAVNLIYVSDQETGIARLKKGNGFIYTFKDQIIDDEKEISRIKKLAIPPAWTKVWICKSPNGHIQATGLDVIGRKQYKYHPRWSALQQETKFHRLYEFGKALPDMRKRLEKDMAQQKFSESKVLAMVVSLMEKTYIRVGNVEYEKRYNSYGLTTLKNKHVVVKGNNVTFSFKGKKGIYHNITLKSKKFARIIKQCKAIPGKELFQYYDESGALRKIDSGQVNQYIKDCTGLEFSTKDFRTWAGTLMMLRILKSAAPCLTATAYQKTIVEAFRAVSLKLGNTVAVCKKHYVHPRLTELYQANQLATFLNADKPIKEGKAGLTREEAVLMNILWFVQREKNKAALTTRVLRAAIKKERCGRKAHFAA